MPSVGGLPMAGEADGFETGGAGWGNDSIDTKLGLLVTVPWFNTRVHHRDLTGPRREDCRQVQIFQLRELSTWKRTCHVDPTTL